VCDACFKENAIPSQVEEVLNGIVSMLALVRPSIITDFEGKIVIESVKLFRTKI